MFELSSERVEQIIYKETPKTEVLPTILRSVYLRYMRMYEKYFADIDALNDDVIAELNQYNQETQSLVKVFYMDIPEDICGALETFDKEYNAKLLGPDWRKTLLDGYKAFKDENKDKQKSEQCLKAEFSQQCLETFYDTMESIFRTGFGTGSKVAENIESGISSWLFGGKKD